MTAPTKQTVVKDMADGIIAIEDGSNPRNSVQVVVDEGDLSFDVIQRASVVLMDRTDLSALRAGKAAPCSGKFRVKLKEFLSSGANYPVTPHEALFGVGAAAGWKSTNRDGGGVRTVRLRFTCISPIPGEPPEDIVFERCFDLAETFSERADADILAVAFKDFEERPTIAKRIGS